MLARLLPPRRSDVHVVREATASIRGSALAVLALVAGLRESLEALAAGERSVRPDDVRARLAKADELLVDLEGQAVHYDGRTPEGAPVTGWQVPAVATAREWLDEVRDAAVRVLRTGAPGA